MNVKKTLWSASTFIVSIFLLAGISYAHCYGSSVSPASGDTYTTFKFCGSTNDLPNLLVDGSSKGSMSTASAGDCTDYSGTEYKFTLTGTGLSYGSHDYKVSTGHGECTGTFEIKSSTTTTTTTTTDEGPYTAGSTQYSWSGSGYSIWQSILKVKEDQTLKGVEQYMTDITTGKKYWAVVIDVGTSKLSSTSYTGTGTVLVAKELGTTSSSTTGWVGTKDGVDVQLKKDHWYIIGVAVDSSASRKWYYKSSSATADFGWAEFQPGSYYDSQNPPDSSFGYYAPANYLLYTRFYLKVTPPEAADTTSPTVTVTGASSGWTKSGTASISCTDSSGCDTNSYKIKTYTAKQTTCSNKYEDYTLNAPYTVESDVWVCGAGKDTKGNIGFSSPVEFKIDATAPSISLDIYRSEQTFWYWVAEVKCSDSKSGCDSNTYATYKSNTEISSCPTDYSTYTLWKFIYIYGSGDYVWICGAAKDAAGNIGFNTPSKQSTDNNRPSTSASLSGTAGDDGWYKSSVEVTLVCSDHGTGCKETKYCTDTTNTCSPNKKYSSPFTISSDGTSYARYYSQDYNLNSELEIGAKSTQVKIDTVKPSTTSSLSGTEGNNGWYVTNVGVKLTCTDTGSGCKGTNYCVDTENKCAPFSIYLTQEGYDKILVDKDGTNYVRFSSKDTAGNSDQGEAVVKLDKTEPTASISINNGDAGTVSRDVTLSLTYSDAASGVDKCRYSNDATFPDKWEACSNTKSWKLTKDYGTKTVYYQVRDNAGKTKDLSDSIDYKSAPVLTSVTPSSAIVKSGGSITVSSVASDEDKDNIRVECGSTTQSNDLCQGAYVKSDPSCSIISPWNDDLSHTVYCRAYDGVLYSEEKSISVTSDNTKPTVNIDSPAVGWFNSDITLQYDATDANIGSCSISTKDGTGEWKEKSTACGSDKTIKITVGDEKYCETQGKDVCSVKVYAKDKAGNENEITRSFSIDLTPPNVDSLSHSPDAITDETDVTINAQATDPLSGLSDVKIFVDSQLKQTCMSSPCVYTAKYVGGKHNYYAKVTDKAGNQQSSSSQSFKVVAPEIIALKSGWNLIALPYKTFEFFSSTCDAGRPFYNYDPTIKTWVVVKQVGDIQAGKGYWVYSDKVCDIKILGDEDSEKSDIQLTTGWNEIGSTSDEPTFNSIKGGCTLQAILYYDISIANWKTLDGSSKMEKYRGYFVKAAC